MHNYLSSSSNRTFLDDNYFLSYFLSFFVLSRKELTKGTVRRNGKWMVLENGEEKPDNPNIIFTKPDVYPIYLAENCKTLQNENNRDELNICSEREVLRFLYQNIEYPIVARENGIEGLVIISVVIDRKGNLTDVVILRDVGNVLAAAAVEATRKLPDNWLPGQKDGQVAITRYNIRYKTNRQILLNISKCFFVEFRQLNWH